MLLRVLVNVDDQAHEIRFVCNQTPLEGTLEQRAASSDGIVDTARISVEKIRKILTGRFFEIW